MISEWIGSDRVGSVIDGRFPLRRWLGGGEESGVFLTRMNGDAAQKAAIKIIPGGIADTESLVAQWIASKRLIHEHLMQIFHAGQCRMDDCGLVFCVTDLADEVLTDVLPVRPLRPAEVREMLIPILDAISWLHSQGLVHGGLKPSNVMVVNEQVNLSVDRVQPAGPRILPVLSPDIHDAPESAEKMTAAADLWSVGVLILEALTQAPPRWDGTRLAGPRIPASVPQPFATIAAECLRLDPVCRCSLNEIKTHLSRAAGVALPAPVAKPSTDRVQQQANPYPERPKAAPPFAPPPAKPVFEKLPPGFLPVIVRPPAPDPKAAPVAAKARAAAPPAPETAKPVETQALPEVAQIPTPPVLEAPPPAAATRSGPMQAPVLESAPVAASPIVDAPVTETPVSAAPTSRTEEPQFAAAVGAPAVPAPKPAAAEAPSEPAAAPADSAASRRAPAAQPTESIAAEAGPAGEPQPTANRRATLVAMAMVLVAASLTLVLALHLSQSATSPPAQSSAKVASPAQSAPPAPVQTAPTQTSPAGPKTVPGAPTTGNGVPSSPRTPGAVLHQVLPEVTKHAMDTINGRLVVIVRAQVDASGNVSSATFEYAGKSHYLQTVALAAARNWKFLPAEAGGQRVPSTWDLQFWFDQNGPRAIAREKTP
jgi:TonB family protein